MAQMVKNLPAMREIMVQSLGWKDPLGKEMATHSSILAWEIPWTEGLGGLQSMVSQRSWARLTDYTTPKVIAREQRTSQFSSTVKTARRQE